MQSIRTTIEDSAESMEAIGEKPRPNVLEYGDVGVGQMRLLTSRLCNDRFCTPSFHITIVARLQSSSIRTMTARDCPSG